METAKKSRESNPTPTTTQAINLRLTIRTEPLVEIDKTHLLLVIRL